MPGDFSRKTFNPKKHYSGVLMQQGRVQLDADWNEQLDIQQHRTHTETVDVVGACGVPKKGNSFKIGVATNGFDLTIEFGHIYVGGLLCESETGLPHVSYLHQPYYPAPALDNFVLGPGNSPLSPELPQPQKMKDGTYIVYVDAWQREINYLDDPLIHEVGIGEADTAVRRQNIWQVKLLAAGNHNSTCKTDFDEWRALTSPPTGRLNVQTMTIASDNPCVLPPSAGYRRLENQLYRVEVQKTGTLTNAASTASFKWSRDNASVETKIQRIEGSTLTVESLGRDEILGFANGQWVEVVDEESALKGTPHQLIQILNVDPAEPKITLATSLIPNKDKSKLKLRRWDQSVAAGADGLPAATGWTNLEDGIQVMFAPGTYRAGDYWLIPARTATGDVEWPPYEIPNLHPVQQAPLGIRHHYCKLAILQVQNGVITVEDCRPKFPSLTEICAEDICFDNRNCDFLEADNVQEALDRLCTTNDLRLHNKLLHGFGVVCGLKVKCRPTRTGVIIEKGNALDCEGNMIQVKNQNGMPYNLVDEAKKYGYLDKNEDGTVCLSIAGGPNKTAVISIEKFVPQKFWDTILEGSLLKDFFDGCIKNLIDFLKKQFKFPIIEQVPVPDTQRRLTAFINLIIQLVNSKSAPYIFLSGNSAIQPDEDRLLREFYNELKALLASETFCAMNDKDDLFPDYQLDAGLTTIFGPPTKIHTRLRLNSVRNFAYTCGSNNNIYVYNLQSQVLIQVSPFPAASNIVLQDIAVATSGTELFAVGIIDNKDSVLARGQIGTAGLITWGTPSTAPGIKFVSLGMGAAGRLFAVGKSRGLYEVVGIGTAAFAPRLIRALNATGLFSVAVTTPLVPFAFVAVDDTHPVGTESSSFTQLSVVNTTNTTGTVVSIPFQGQDNANDMLLSGSTLYVTGNDATGTRMLRGYSITTGGQVAGMMEVPVGDDSIIRLGAYTVEHGERYILLTMSDQYKVSRAVVKSGRLELDGNFRIPVQLYPVGIAIDEKNQRGYVLNMFVNTLTAMNMPQVFHTAPAPDYTSEPPYNLALYRDGVIEAYSDVLSHLVQYLKDCFCDKFLIDSPECGEDDKVYLGCVEVKGGKVYNICNFSKRRYVKSFHTVEYWLSTVPILPVVREAFTKFCCSVL